MKRPKTKPEPKPITAQPPDGCEQFAVDAPVTVARDGPRNVKTCAPGCYHVTKKRGAE